MIIQPILFPDRDICGENDLYFRTHGNGIEFCPHKESVIMAENSSLSFNTFFNSLSSDAIFKYTKAQDITLLLRVNGTFRVSIFLAKFNGDMLFEENVFSDVFNSNDEICVPVGNVVECGKYYFSITAIDGEVKFFGGEYLTDIDIEDNIKIALDICTFHREAELTANIASLRQNIIDNKQSMLFGKIFVYIANQGGSIRQTVQTDSFVKIFDQGDFGASAGFARGMIEAKKEASQTGITHIIVMDDDIILDSRVIERLYCFLRLLKDEYKDAIIGSGNIDALYRYIQIEFGGLWNNGHPTMLHHNTDLRKWDLVVRNDVNNRVEYAGWWFACVPAILWKNELPMPLFMKRDDQEYSLRSRKEIILFNGICVWHLPYHVKYGSWLDYFLVRNYLIVQSIHGENFTKKEFRSFLFNIIKSKLSRYRYKEAYLVLSAVKDFLKGFERYKQLLLTENPEQKLESLISDGYNFFPIEELPVKFDEDTLLETRKRGKETARRGKKLLWGMLSKAKYTAIGQAATISPFECYQAHQVLNLDYTFQKGFITQKSLCSLAAVLLKYMAVSMKISVKFKRCTTEYRERYRELTCLDFWEKYLKIDNN